MRTALTDRTLSYVKYNEEHVTGELLRSYAKAVKLCGADYIEIDAKTAAKMELDDFSEDYILRVSTPYDFGYSTVMRFAYVAVPFRYAGWIERLPEGQPAIVEVNADEYSAQAVLMYLKRFRFMEKVTAVRLVGVFGDSIARLVKWARDDLFIPLDICPLNTMMTGVSDAVEADGAGVPMLTLSFGRGYYFTSMEQYIINKHISQRVIMKNEIIKAICLASFVFADIFSVIPAGLSSMLETESELNASVYDAESGVLFRPYRSTGRSRRAAPTESAVEKKIRSIGFERDIEDAILDMLKKVNFSFYKEISKRNLID